MRVLHLISSAGWYGAENLLVNLAAASRTLRCDATVGVLRDARNPHTEAAEHAERRGVPAEIYDCSGRLDLGTAIRLRSRLRKGVDILHSHGYKANWYAGAAAWGLDVRLVSTCHTGTERPESTPLLSGYEILNRFLLRRMDRVVAVSTAIADGLRRQGIAEPRLATIGNGVDGTLFHDPHPRLTWAGTGKKVVGTVGRLIREKGPYSLLEAARRVVEQAPDTLFLFIGDGPEREELSRTAERLGLTGNVRFAGQRSDMAAVYASLDVFVLPSFSEGMPMTVLEAMAAGLPIVASRVGTIPSLLEPSECGLLCSPGNAEELAEALLRMLRDEPLARRMGATAQWVQREHYSAEAMARRYLELYAQI